MKKLLIVGLLALAACGRTTCICHKGDMTYKTTLGDAETHHMQACALACRVK